MNIIKLLIFFGITSIQISASVVSQNGIAKDNMTGLIWQDTIDTVTKEKSWKDAKQYCTSLKLGGYKDWRLPNIYEAYTLIDSKKGSDPYVVDGFEYVTSLDYWSFTQSGQSKDYIWTISLRDGGVTTRFNSNSTYSRCVRGKLLTYDNLTSLVQQGKLLGDPKLMNDFSPLVEQKRKNEAEEYYKKQLEQQEKEKKQVELAKRQQVEEQKRIAAENRRIEALNRKIDAENEKIRKFCDKFYIGEKIRLINDRDDTIFASTITSIDRQNATVYFNSVSGYGHGNCQKLANDIERDRKKVEESDRKMLEMLREIGAERAFVRP